MSDRSLVMRPERIRGPLAEERPRRDDPPPSGGKAKGPERSSHLAMPTQPRTEAKGTCHGQERCPRSGRRNWLPFPGPGAASAARAAPRGRARPTPRAWPPRPPAGPATPRPLRRSVPRAPSPPEANFAAAVLYLSGGSAAAELAVSAAHPPPGAPGRRRPAPGPPGDLAVPAPLPARAQPEREPGRRAP